MTDFKVGDRVRVVNNINALLSVGQEFTVLDIRPPPFPELHLDGVLGSWRSNRFELVAPEPAGFFFHFKVGDEVFCKLDEGGVYTVLAAQLLVPPAENPIEGYRLTGPGPKANDNYIHVSHLTPVPPHKFHVGDRVRLRHTTHRVSTVAKTPLTLVQPYFMIDGGCAYESELEAYTPLFGAERDENALDNRWIVRNNATKRYMGATMPLTEKQARAIADLLNEDQ